MVKEQTFNLDKMVTEAKKRLEKHTEKLATKAHEVTAKDFAEARKRLGIK